MHDVLATILERADCAPPLFYADEVDAWPTRSMESWLGQGLLHPSMLATSLPCYRCGNHIAEVVFLKNSRGRQAYLRCPECGPTQIDPARLRRWEVDFNVLQQLLSDDLGCRGRIKELYPRQFWQLGSACLGGHRHNIYFGRTLYGRELVNRCQIPASGIVFVPSAIPDINAIERRLTLISLRTALSPDVDSFHLDQAYIESQLVDYSEPAPRKKAMPKRAERSAMIAALTEAMIAHLRIAYEHACITEEKTGEPQLLPRPTQRQLANHLGASPASINRCLADETARELHFLWDLAVDLDKIMYHGKQVLGCLDRQACNCN